MDELSKEECGKRRMRVGSSCHEIVKYLLVKQKKITKSYFERKGSVVIVSEVHRVDRVLMRLGYDTFASTFSPPLDFTWFTLVSKQASSSKNRFAERRFYILER